MAEQELTYEQRVETLMKQWNCLIDELSNAKRHVESKQARPYDDAIESLIVLREATRRGLLRLEEAEETLGSEIPVTKTGEREVSPEVEPGVIRRALEGDFDILKSPKTRYGPEG